MLVLLMGLCLFNLSLHQSIIGCFADSFILQTPSIFHLGRTQFNQSIGRSTKLPLINLQQFLCPASLGLRSLQPKRQSIQVCHCLKTSHLWLHHSLHPLHLLAFNAKSQPVPLSSQLSLQFQLHPPKPLLPRKICNRVSRLPVLLILLCTQFPKVA